MLKLPDPPFSFTLLGARSGGGRGGGETETVHMTGYNLPCQHLCS